jgi:type II secretory pathway component GspD/PulD (secretin)
MYKKYIILLNLVFILSNFLNAEVMTSKITKYYYLNYITPKEFKYLTSKLIPNIPIEINDELKLVVLNDTIENINIFENILKQLDVKIPQIQISAKIVETKLVSTDKLGVNWTWQDLFNNSNKEIKSFFENFVSTDSRFQLQFGTLRVDSFNAILNFLLSQTNSDLLSSPTIVTLNNKEASINTGDQIPIRTTTTQGTVTMVTTVFKETGVKLKVTPSIKEDDFILLDIHPEVSEVLEYSSVTGDPIISQRKVDGSIIIKDNETLMVGGLLRNKTLLGESKLPILGDIPLLGILFKKQTVERAKTEIIIFITPHIIKEGEKFIAPDVGK